MWVPFVFDFFPCVGSILLPTRTPLQLVPTGRKNRKLVALYVIWWCHISVSGSLTFLYHLLYTCECRAYAQLTGRLWHTHTHTQTHRHTDTQTDMCTCKDEYRCATRTHTHSQHKHTHNTHTHTHTHTSLQSINTHSSPYALCLSPHRPSPHTDTPASSHTIRSWVPEGEFDHVTHIYIYIGH
jgi:hypothetical protein